ncbi:MAG: hypothetical protein HGB26_07060 [Desulfobulbaceae bacterium]|nr:hypothetical protein [Desulfobulbaceae bacterium]
MHNNNLQVILSSYQYSLMILIVNDAPPPLFLLDHATVYDALFCYDDLNRPGAGQYPRGRRKIMVRKAEHVADILKELYDQSFGNEECEQYRLGWADLRALAGVAKLTEAFIAKIGAALAESGHALIPLGDFLLVGYERDFAGARRLPARLLEQYLPEEDTADADTDDDEEFEED